MNREMKKLNKEHCKDMPLDIKLQCWFFRNSKEIGIVLSTVLTIVALYIILLL